MRWPRRSRLLSSRRKDPCGSWCRTSSSIGTPGTRRLPITNSSNRQRNRRGEGLARRRARPGAAHRKRERRPGRRKHGLVVRGYVSRLDGSVQPYGLVVPKSYTKEETKKYRLDFWFHGRGETLSEVNFLRDREKNVGTFAPPDAIVLHPYGRYCNANKFAGEIDALEATRFRPVAVSHRRRSHRRPRFFDGRGVDLASGRPLSRSLGGRQSGGRLRGDSALSPMSFTRSRSRPRGGRSSSITCMTAPTGPTICGIVPPWPTPAKSIRKSRRPTSWPTPWRRRGSIWSTSSARRRSTRTILRPGTKSSGESPPWPQKGAKRIPETVHFTTYTLHYNNCAWITVDALDRHWERARIEAHRDADESYTVRAENIKAFTIELPPRRRRLRPRVKVQVAPLGQDAGGCQVESTATSDNNRRTASFHRKERRQLGCGAVS